jgi:F0F1-type ATP synthase epsilon subunit
MSEQWTVSAPEKLVFDGEVTRLRVRTVAGAVNVVATDGPARIEVTEIEGAPLTVTLEGGELTVAYDDLSWKDFSWKTLVSVLGKWQQGSKRRAVVSLAVPATARVELGSASSDTVISGITAPVTVHSASGSTTLVRLSGPVDANTVSGSVQAQAVSGDLKVNTVSGELTVFEGASGSIKAHSVSGPVTVDLAHDNTIDLHVSNVSGEVAVRIPAPTDAEVHANTTSGDLSNAFDELRIAGTWGAKQITGTLGKGTGKLKITTVSGSVALLRRPAAEDDSPADAPRAIGFTKEDLA